MLKVILNTYSGSPKNMRCCVFIKGQFFIGLSFMWVWIYYYWIWLWKEGHANQDFPPTHDQRSWHLRITMRQPKQAWLDLFPWFFWRISNEITRDLMIPIAESTLHPQLLKMKRCSFQRLLHHLSHLSNAICKAWVTATKPPSFMLNDNFLLRLCAKMSVNLISFLIQSNDDVFSCIWSTTYFENWKKIKNMEKI